MKPHSLKLTAVATALILAAALARAAAPASEAPTGFDTPTLAQNPGSRSVSNGFPQPAGDSYARDQKVFEMLHDEASGLGPVYNARSCAECHQNGVTGGASQFTEVRAGHHDANGNFVNPTVPINGGAASISGRSIIDDRALKPEAQEHLPASEDIRALRSVLSTLGDGFIEAIDDSTLLAIAAAQPLATRGRIHGEAVSVALFEAPGQTRVGRFGWKDQHASLLSFSADSYLNEIGVTSRLRPRDTTNVAKTTVDPEDVPDELGLANIDHFAQFMRGTKAPPRDAVLAATPNAVAGAQLFNAIGCGTCHVSTITTAATGTSFAGGAYVVPEAVGNKVIHPFSDFLMHDVGTGDGIVQGGPADTANKLRTVPLWGLRIRSRFMHDLRSLTLQEAIARHRGEATLEALRFRALNDTQQQQLLTFLGSL